ncbi:MAG: isocitrate/isopropylmalate dehydrogenase family protein [Candidatus Thorarchaeota archaeon]|jgi:3-isopropylmalate dehydrogenase
MARKYKISVLPGDGIGKEVIPEAVAVMKAAITHTSGLEIELHEFACGGEYFLKNGHEWSEEAEEFTKSEADAILLGGVGAKDADGGIVRRPNGNMAGYSVIIGLRQDLELYANVRPVKLYERVPTPLANKGPKDIDMVIVRENTEGLYIPARGRLTGREEGDLAVDLRVITASGAERISRYAFNLAKRRNGAPSDGQKRVTCVDKSNLLAGCRLFRESFNKIGESFPDVAKDYAYVDAWTLLAIQKPEQYDVVVAPNEFGDIISDLGAALHGGLGISPSGNIGEKHGMFEPVHGSAPDIAGKSIANPLAAILSAAMMFDWLGIKHGDEASFNAATRIRSGVKAALGTSNIRTPDLCVGEWSKVKPSTTQEVTAEVIKRLSG